jgi:hypothetical protein
MQQTQKLDLSSEEVQSYEHWLKCLMIDEIKIGLGIFSKNVKTEKREINCSLEWTNSIFDLQFELKPKKVEDTLNLKIFKDYLKGPKGSIDSRHRSLLDLIVELDSQGSQGSIYKVFETIKEKNNHSQPLENRLHSSFSFADFSNQSSKVNVVIINAIKKIHNKQNYYLFSVHDISNVLTKSLQKV